MVTPLNIGFTRLSQADFLNHAQRIVTAMTGNKGFPEPWPGSVPTLTELTADLNAFMQSQIAALDGSRVAIAARGETRDKLTQGLLQLAQYVVLEAQGNPELLSSSGFELRKPRTRQNAEVLSPPSNVVVERGEISGTLTLRTRPLKGAASYEVQVCSADPTQDANWSDAGTFARSTRILVEGLTPGKIYFGRVRGIGSAGPGAWTAPTSVMVV